MENSIENKTGNPRMATFLERFVAYFIDYLLLIILLFPIIGFLEGSFGGKSFSFESGLSAFVFLAVTILYFVWFYANKGQSIGKMAMKLKVVRSKDLKYLKYEEALLREVIRIFLSGIILYLGYLWYFMSPKRQTWHDNIASSYVVKTDEKGEILMDGELEYKKEPVKTFSICGCLLLVVIASLVLLVYGVFLISNMGDDFGVPELDNFPQNMPLDDQPSFEEDIEIFDGSNQPI